MLIMRQARIMLGFCFRRRGKAAGFVVLSAIISFGGVLVCMYVLPVMEFSQSVVGARKDTNVLTWTPWKRTASSRGGTFSASAQTQLQEVTTSENRPVSQNRVTKKFETIYEKLKTVAHTTLKHLRTTTLSTEAVSGRESTETLSNTSKSLAHPSSKPNQSSVVMTTKAEKDDCGDLEFYTEDEELQLFKPGVTGKNFCLFKDTVKTLTEALTQANIPYFLYGGTLIGSWRHHGMVPWDDDVDIAVDFKRQEDLRHILDKLEPRYHYKVRATVSWKFYSQFADRIFPHSWSWPFIDICFFDENATHVSEHDLKYFPEYIFPKDWVFPLTLRPYDGMFLSCPKETQKVLEHTYKLSDCAIGRHSHKKEKAKQDAEVTTVDCEALKPLYPFVKRVSLGVDRGCNETLVTNGTVVSWKVLENLRC